MRAIAILLGGLVAALPAAAETLETSAGPMRVQAMATGLDEPWGLAFLPDGSFLVTERDGRLLRVAEGAAVAVGGVPEVAAEGQGGLLDVMLPADFATSREVWLAFSASAPGGLATAAGRGRLSADGTRLERFETLFLGDGARGGRHFGARLVEMPDGAVVLTTGDRGTGPEGLAAQDPASSIGKVVRMARDGSVVALAPGWRAGVISLGHRNIQGAALDAGGRLMTVEHGAQGGDELNAPVAGRNYGWPVISHGQDYGGGRIGTGTAAEGMEQPLHYWDPSIAPSGLMVYSGALVPDWRGDIFFGSLNSDFLGRLDPDTPAATGYAEERIAGPQTGRVRDVAEAPDGSIWFLSVQDGAVYRLAP